MLIVLNGAPKGGSTWLVLIVQAMNLFERIPTEYQDEKWVNSSIAQDKLDLFLNECIYQDESYFCKQHWTNSGEIKAADLLADSNIRMVNIIRDIRDVLVSRYFHDLRLNLTQEDDIAKYYWSMGKKNMIKYMEYHNSWHAPGVEQQPFLCSYERLHRNFMGQMTELVAYLELGEKITAEEIKQIKGSTSIDKRKDKGKGKFFRKGIVGDWQNHLSAEIVADMKKTAIEMDYLATKRNMMQTFKLDILKNIDFGV
ncbi:MAG: sulfotransferase domain-containing protein [Cyanobacteria bacterium P01_C01_bin.72]